MVRVVIADDAVHVRQELRRAVELHPGFQVVGEASDGREALRVLQKERPDAVVMDLKMPGMDGLEATRRIKALWPEVKVVVLTANGGCRSDALAAGADEFLTKGCPIVELMDAISITGIAN